MVHKVNYIPSGYVCQGKILQVPFTGSLYFLGIDESGPGNFTHCGLKPEIGCDIIQGSKSKFMEADFLYIRQERPADYDMVYHVVKAAFANAEHSDGNEQNLVVALRESKSFIPELSLVAVEDSKIVGHILFTKALVSGIEVLALAPLSVLPEYQNRGIGLSLIRQGHIIARQLGYNYSIVLGHSKYYPKADYVPASQYGVKAPFEVEDENFMIVCLSGSKDKLNGIIEYDKAFGI